MDLAESTSLQNFTKLKSSADFCLECGDMLTLPIYSDFIECPKCGFKVSILGIAHFFAFNLRLPYRGDCDL